MRFDEVTQWACRRPSDEEQTMRWQENFEFLLSMNAPLPPLFVCDLTAALSGKTQSPGREIRSRQYVNEWGEWIRSLATMINNVRHRIPDRKVAQNVQRDSLRRIGRYVSWELVGACDFSVYYDAGSWNAKLMVKDQLDWLRNGTANRIGEASHLLDEWVGGEKRKSLLPPGIETNLEHACLWKLDPFVRPLLQLATPDQCVQRLVGRPGKSRSHKMVRSERGAFDRREPGGLPDEIGRLAPHELALLQGSGSAENEGQVDPWRLWFVVKDSEGALMQRWSKHPERAKMVPHVRLIVEVENEISLHRQLKHRGFPVLSWYRACAIEMLRMLSIAGFERDWRSDAELWVLGEGHGYAYIASDALNRMAVGHDALDLVCAAAPFFVDWTALQGTEAEQGRQVPDRLNACCRIVFGNMQSSVKTCHVTAEKQLGVRIQCKETNVLFKTYGSCDMSGISQCEKQLSCGVGAVVAAWEDAFLRSREKRSAKGITELELL